MPDRPRESASQNGATPQPNDDTTPMPVIATLDTRHQFLHSFGYVTNGAERLSGFIGNIDIELVFDSEDDINTIERVDLEFLKRAFRFDSVQGDTLGFRNDADHSGHHVFRHTDRL